MSKSNPSQNTMPKSHLPKLLIREHSIGIFDVFKGLDRGYSYICRLRTAAGYLDLEHIQTRATFCPKSRTSLDAKKQPIPEHHAQTPTTQGKNFAVTVSFATHSPAPASPSLPAPAPSRALSSPCSAPSAPDSARRRS